MKPQSIEGDLMGLSLVEAHINRDMKQIEALLSEMQSREELLGAIRCLTNAFSATLCTNLTPKGGLMQIKMYRDAMLKDFYGAVD